eukprot:GHVP01022260.1.p1 GENE.GHVP01022260.1~~GHVP01022260.1.p1  ORF type:complete len:100 (+),score=5.88 GHVP01022260.1:49-348(+)
MNIPNPPNPTQSQAQTPPMPHLSMYPITANPFMVQNPVCAGQGGEIPFSRTTESLTQFSQFLWIHSYMVDQLLFYLEDFLSRWSRLRQRAMDLLTAKTH